MYTVDFTLNSVQCTHTEEALDVIYGNTGAQINAENFYVKSKVTKFWQVRKEKKKKKLYIPPERAGAQLYHVCLTLTGLVLQ